MYRTRFQKWRLTKYISRNAKIGPPEKLRYIDHDDQTSRYEEKLDSTATKKKSPRLGRYSAQGLWQQQQLDKNLDFPSEAETSMKVMQVQRKIKASNYSMTSQPTPALSIPVSFNPATSPEQPNMFALFQAVQICSLESVSCETVTAASRNFWLNAQQAIYFFRIGSTEKAWTCIHMTCSLAFSTMSEQNIWEFVIEAIATFSPVNMRSCPAVRSQVLAYLAQLCAIVLGSRHPVVVVIKQLVLDQLTRDVTERCISLVIDTLKPFQCRSVRLSIIKAYLSLARHLRKDGEYNAALRMTQQAYETAVNEFGTEAMSTCRVLREQSHILIDEGNYDKALRLCSRILHCDTSNWVQNEKCAYMDCCIATMEDIAYIFERVGDERLRTAWLYQAGHAAEICWGKSNATTHIQDRIDGFRIEGICK